LSKLQQAPDILHTAFWHIFFHKQHRLANKFHDNFIQK